MPVDLAKLLSDRLKQRETDTEAAQQQVDSQVESQESVESEAAEEVSSPASEPIKAASKPEQKPVNIKSVLESKGYEVGDLDEVKLGEHIAELLAQSEKQKKIEQELAETRAALERYRTDAQLLASKQTEQPQQPTGELSKKQETQLRKWAKINLDQDDTVLCDYDSRLGRYVGKPKFGVAGDTAASRLNQAMLEASRRQQLIVNDLDAALDESGVKDAMLNTFRSELEGFKKSLFEDIDSLRYKTAQQQIQERYASEVQDFYSKHASEILVVDANGVPKKDLTGREVVTPFGQVFQQEVKELMSDGLTDQLQIARLAYRNAKKLVPDKKPEEVAKDKKKTFVQKTREAARPPASRQPANPETPSSNGKPKSFRELLLTDPDNAEHLGEFYQGV